MDNKTNSVLFLLVLLFLIWLNRTGKLKIIKALIQSGSYTKESDGTGSTLKGKIGG